MKTIKNNIKGIFENNEIRKQEFNSEVFYVIEDVIKFIIQSENPKEYLHKLQSRNLELKSSWVQFVHPLNFETSQGKRKINCTNLDGIFKLIEFIPSKKIEKFKRHLYEIGLLKINEVGK